MPVRCMRWQMRTMPIMGGAGTSWSARTSSSSSPALVISEAAYLIASRLGSAAEAVFVRSLGRFEVEAPTPEDWDRIADLVERYADFPLGASDASVAVLADRLGTDTVVTLDRRHFAALRSQAGGSYRLLPD